MKVLSLRVSSPVQVPGFKEGLVNHDAEKGTSLEPHTKCIRGQKWFFIEKVTTTG